MHLHPSTVQTMCYCKTLDQHKDSILNRPRIITLKQELYKTGRWTGISFQSELRNSVKQDPSMTCFDSYFM